MFKVCEPSKQWNKIHNKMTWVRFDQTLFAKQKIASTQLLAKNLQFNFIISPRSSMKSATSSSWICELKFVRQLPNQCAVSQNCSLFAKLHLP